MDTRFTLGQRIILILAAIFGPTLIYIYGKTWRVKWSGEDHLAKARAKSPNVIYVFWHSRLFGLTFTHRFRNAGIMVSQSFDGEWITRIVRNMGYRPFRGSSSRGGAKVLLEMLKKDDAGDLALTVDGPKGPAEKVKAGAILLASETGMPVVPITAISSKAWRLKSWDRFILPKPFSELTVAMGEGIEIPANLDKNEIRRYQLIIEEGLAKIG